MNLNEFAQYTCSTKTAFVRVLLLTSQFSAPSLHIARQAHCPLPRLQKAVMQKAERGGSGHGEKDKKPTLRPTEVTPQLEVEQLLDVGMRFEGLRALITALSRSGLSTTVRRGSIVITRYDIPSLRIVEAQSYEVTDIYLQGPLKNDEIVSKIRLDSLDSKRPTGTESFTLYVKLFSSQYHTEPVICTPEEVGLVTLRDEVIQSLKIAAPIVGLWISICILFWSYGSITTPRPPLDLPQPPLSAARQTNPTREVTRDTKLDSQTLTTSDLEAGVYTSSPVEEIPEAPYHSAE